MGRRLFVVALVTLALLAGMVAGAVSVGRARDLPPIMMRRGAFYMLDIGYGRTYSMGRTFSGVPDDYTADSPAGPDSLMMRDPLLLQAEPYSWVVHTMYRTRPGGEEYRVRDNINAVYWEPGMERVMVHVAHSRDLALYLLDVATDDLTLIENRMLYSRCADAAPWYCLYVSGRPDSNRNQLMLLDVNTGESREIASGNLSDNFNPWSPDGEKFAYVRIEQGGGVVYLYDVASATSRALLTLPRSDIYILAWSHDGAWLRVSASERGNVEAIQIASTSGERPPLDVLAMQPTLLACNRWSPTAAVLLCRMSDTDKDTHHLYTLTLPSGDLEPLITVQSSRTPQVVWAPNGTQLAVQLEQNSTFPLYTVPLDKPRLRLVDGDDPTSSTLRWQDWQTDDFVR